MITGYSVRRVVNRDDKTGRSGEQPVNDPNAQADRLTDPPSRRTIFRTPPGCGPVVV
jgi:hypothetical protein